MFIFKENAFPQFFYRPKFLYPLYIDDGGDGSGGGGDQGDSGGPSGDDTAAKATDDIDPGKIKDFADGGPGGGDADKASDDAGDQKPKVGLEKLLDGKDDKKPSDDDSDKSDFNIDHIPEHLRGENPQATVDKLFKAYQGQRNKGTAPKDVADYKIDLPENVVGLLDPDNADDAPVYDAIKDLAKEQGLSVEQYNGLVGGMLGKFQELGLIEVPIDAEEHFKMIGGKGGVKKGQQIAEVCLNWLDGAHRKEILDDKEFEEAKIMAGTANGVRVMMKLRGMTGAAEIPTNFESQSDKMSRAELQARQMDPRQDNDPAFQKETERLYAEKYPG